MMKHCLNDNNYKNPAVGLRIVKLIHKIITYKNKNMIFSAEIILRQVIPSFLKQ